VATAVVVPAYNEELKIQQVLENLLTSNNNHIIVIVNGCTDNTLQKAKEMVDRDARVKIFNFKEKLGIDIPRAVGAKIALEYGVNAVGFVDGDMSGMFIQELEEIFSKVVTKTLDLSLANCYDNQNIQFAIKEKHRHEVFEWRALLSRKFGIAEILGIASPMHGPHVISSELISKIPLEYLAIPPAVLAFAIKNNYKVGIGASINHCRLRSTWRHGSHNTDINDTIIGDCIYALNLYEGKVLNRIQDNHNYDGYHSTRKFEYLTMNFEQSQVA